MLRFLSLFQLLFVLFVFVFPAAVLGDETETIQLRRGISNLFFTATQNEMVFSVCESDAVPSFEGGSVDVYPVYLKEFAATCRQWFPNTTFSFKTYNGKTRVDSEQPGSHYGVYRYRRADATLGNTIGGARLAVIDLAQSDLDKTEQQLIDAVEGIVRQSYQDLDVVFVYAGISPFVNDYLAGKTPTVIVLYEKIAEHYGVPSINFAKNAAEKIKSGTITSDEYFEGVKYYKRNDKISDSKGNDLDTALFVRFLELCHKNKTTEPALLRRQLPKPISPTNMENAGIVPYELGQYNRSDWQEGVARKPSVPFLRHLLVGSKPGAVFSIKFKGSRCGFIDLLAADTADIEYRVDDAAWTRLDGNAGRGLTEPVRRNFPDLIHGLDPRQEHRFEIRIAEQQPASASPRTERLGVLLIDGVVDDPYQGKTLLERIDAVYEKMVPIQYEFPSDRWQHIPKTIRKLQNGEPLRIVMLGDSIMGDTGSSHYNLLLERMYPGSKVERIMSLRGSTGCWYYQEENRVESYVLKHNPDLLMIGGISNRNDTEAIRSVIHQVRRKQSPEIMLITPVFGAMTDAHLRNWTFNISDNPEDYRNKLRKLAEEENCEFVDLTGAFHQYITNSGRSYGWYMRDGVHANERGFQIIGRLLIQFFSPKK
ncbi:MAG: SGNH/GDSL hydrolase family protein [Planctomycetaceae bacterium]|nr:SGNH/GDSL hydrolase family protein [Planctomycetaceae bacterium]